MKMIILPSIFMANAADKGCWVVCVIIRWLREAEQSRSEDARPCRLPHGV